jgi:glutaminyl-tRNA synthetase
MTIQDPKPKTHSLPAGDAPSPTEPKDFLRVIVEDDLKAGKHGGHVVTRFPPEPNGFLHIGHASSINLNFGIARDYGGRCHLRFDDTNPTKEEQRYIDGIKADVKWLGFDWGKHEYHASDYFEQLYQWAVLLIRNGKAFVCDLSADQVRQTRGTLTEPGKESPFRHRSVEENLDLFDRMRIGEFPDGSRTLRAKIDMNAPNLNLRDPVMYRILHAMHPRTGDKWCIYPMYDWAHGQSDWIEGITHSICTLEFEDHRPLYDWFVNQIDALGGAPKGVKHHPRQYEFARRNLSHTVMSKRKLLELVNDGVVRGWDDPRMPTIAGMRRRGYTAAALRNYCDTIGIARRENVIDMTLLEFAVREDLNRIAPRRFAVLNPVLVVIDNYPEGQVEELEVVNNPEDESAGTRKVQFGREIYIEQDDFADPVPAKFFRLSPGKEVRLRAAYYITCIGVDRDPVTGAIRAIHCTYDSATRGGWSQDGRKVKGTLHWVSARHAIKAEMRLYDRLFTVENPDAGDAFRANLNPKSLEIVTAQIEPAMANAKPGDRVQFERQGYFCVDPDSTPGTNGRLVFNRTVPLKDSWAKQKV